MPLLVSHRVLTRAHLGAQTPAQTFQVIFDTGSADLIIPDSGCSACDSSTDVYVPSDSSTAATSSTAFQITYGSGYASGVLVRDDVTVANYTSTDQVFALVDQIQGIIQGDIDGICGMAYQSISQTGYAPPVQALANAGMLPSDVFGFYLLDVEGFSSNLYRNGGVMTIGGVDTSLYTGDINWVELASSGTYWDIPLDALAVNGNDLGVTADRAIIDTGTSLIAAPQSVCESIYSQLGGSATTVSGVSGYYGYPCDTPVSVTFTFGGQDYTVDSEAFNSGYLPTDYSTCLGAFFALDAGNDPTAQSSTSISWIVGASFLKTVYSAYRFSGPPAVGFAQLGSGGTANGISSTTGGSTETNSDSTGAAVATSSSAGTVGAVVAAAALALVSL